MTFWSSVLNFDPYKLFKALDIQDFIERTKGNNNLLDVRSPGEFEQGHIPGAKNLVLFSNEERAEIGTLYKQKGRQTAVIRGLEIVGPKLTDLVNTAKISANNNELCIHCWRGGMRSGFVATLLDMYGVSVFTLKGGYKKFRTLALSSFTENRKFYILGGKTGSGKTYILQKLKQAGEQVVDLEGIAHHKGSAFGALGELPQPTQEQFENELFFQLANTDHSKPVWLEDESRLVGHRLSPPPMWENMRASKVFFLEIPFEERLNHIIEGYGKFKPEELQQAIIRISKRLGPEQTKNSLMAIEAGDVRTAFDYCLRYYDKTYSHGLTKREDPDIEKIEVGEFNIEKCSELLLKKVR
jgi:tRNA 2-selenouridine synthase